MFNGGSRGIFRKFGRTPENTPSRNLKRGHEEAWKHEKHGKRTFSRIDLFSTKFI